MGEYGSPESPYIIPIPGWDDVVKIKPRQFNWRLGDLAKEDWAEYFRNRSYQSWRNCRDPGKCREIHRRWLKMEQLKASPSPEIVRTIATIMTYIDDTEDLISTVLVLGKILVKKLPWLAVKIGSRAIPYLGWALLATDILELGNILWRWAPFGRKGKKRSWDIINPRSWGRRGRLRRVSRFMNRVPGVPELLEAGQASETLFGVGIQIGPLLGMGVDGTFAAIKQAQGKTVQIAWPEDALSVWFGDRIARGMNAATGLMVLPESAGQDVHMMAMIALALGTQNIQPILNSEVKINRVDETLGWYLPKEVPWDPMTRLILQDGGIDPDREEPHFWPGTPMNLSREEHRQGWQIGAIGPLLEYNKIFNFGVDGMFSSSTLLEFIRGVWNADLPREEWDAEDPEFDTPPEHGLVIEGVETGMRPPLDSPISKLELLKQDYAQEVGRSPYNRIGSIKMKQIILNRFGRKMSPSLIPEEWAWNGDIRRRPA